MASRRTAWSCSCNIDWIGDNTWQWCTQVRLNGFYVIQLIPQATAVFGSGGSEALVGNVFKYCCWRRNDSFGIGWFEQVHTQGPQSTKPSSRIQQERGQQAKQRCLTIQTYESGVIIANLSLYKMITYYPLAGQGRVLSIERDSNASKQRYTELDANSLS